MKVALATNEKLSAKGGGTVGGNNATLTEIGDSK